MNLVLIPTDHILILFADTISRVKISSEAEMEARKGYAILYVKSHTNCNDW